MLARFVTKMLMSVTLGQQGDDGERRRQRESRRRAAAGRRPTSVPNTASRMSAAIGRLMSSAWTRSSSIFSLNSLYSCGMPVIVITAPSGASSRSLSSWTTSTASSSDSVSVTTASVFVPSSLRSISTGDSP